MFSPRLNSFGGRNYGGGDMTVSLKIGMLIISIMSMTGPHRIARQGLATCKWRGRRDGEIAGRFDTASLLSAKGGGHRSGRSDRTGQRDGRSGAGNQLARAA